MVELLTFNKNTKNFHSLYANIPGVEKKSGVEMSLQIQPLGLKCLGVEVSLGSKCLQNVGVEMSWGRNVWQAKTSRSLPRTHMHG